MFFFSFFHFIWVNKHQTITNWGVWEKDFFVVVHRNGKGAGPLENFDLSSNLEIQSHWKQASRIPRPLAAVPPDVDIVYKLPLVSAAAGCGSASFSPENWFIQSNSDWRKIIRIGLLRCSGKNRVLLGWRAAIDENNLKWTSAVALEQHLTSFRCREAEQTAAPK